MDYLDWLRWPDGLVCPACGWTTSRGPSGRVWRCGNGECRKRVSRTAGTIFQDTRTPLTVWFAAGWYMTADPGGVSALTMQKLLGLGLVPDGVGDAAPLPHRDGPPGPGGAVGSGGGRGDDPGRGADWDAWKRSARCE